jgi:hypothetical protein
MPWLPLVLWSSNGSGHQVVIKWQPDDDDDDGSQSAVLIGALYASSVLRDIHTGRPHLFNYMLPLWC